MIRLHERKENKMQYEAIFELHEVFNDLRIDHILQPLYDGYQIVVNGISFAQHMGSYGSQDDLIEACDYEGQQEGYLSVFGCLEYLKERQLL